MHGDDIAGAGPGISQRVVHGDAGAHERPGLHGRKVIGDRRQGRRWRDEVLRVPAVKIHAGHLAIDAHRKIATTTILAAETMTAVPAYTDALALGPTGDAGSESVDTPADFVTRH